MSDEAFIRLPGTPEYAPGWNRTLVARPVAIVLSLVFGAGLLVVPAIDFLTGSWQAPGHAAASALGRVTQTLRQPGDSWFRRAMDANNAALAGMQNFETLLEDSSRAVAAVRPETLDLLLRAGAAGSEEAYVGKDRWLFYRPDVDPLWQPGNSPAEASAGLAKFGADLADRGVRLVFVAIPGKATIHPEKIGLGEFTEPVMPEGWETFPDKVARAWQEIAAPDAPMPVVVDATGLLWGRKQATGQPQFLETDSHWTPEAMEAVAREVALALRKTGIAAENSLAWQSGDLTGIGDTARMLDLPDGSVFLQPQTVEVSRLPEWCPSASSEILLLGDSYANIYSADDLGWGSEAGLAEQISRFLGKPIDRLSRNDAGASEARRMLASMWSKDDHRFKAKKVVVWQLAMRELLAGDWGHVPLPDQKTKYPPSTENRFFVAPTGQPVEVTGIIRSTGSMPRPGETPYADFLTAVHLGDLRDTASGNKLDAEALVYVFTMRERRLLPAASLVAGQEVRALLLNYGENAARLDPLNRSEPDDVELMLQEPNFAEWILPSRS